MGIAKAEFATRAILASFLHMTRHPTLRANPSVGHVLMDPEQFRTAERLNASSKLLNLISRDIDLHEFRWHGGLGISINHLTIPAGNIANSRSVLTEQVFDEMDLKAGVDRH